MAYHSVYGFITPKGDGEPYPTFDEKEFVTKQTGELPLAGCITEVNHLDTHVARPLGVVNKSVKRRLILDLRYVNKFLPIPNFKHEDLRTARDTFTLEEKYLKFDYKSGNKNQNTTVWNFAYPPEFPRF